MFERKMDLNSARAFCNKFKYLDKVMMVNEEKHRMEPELYPENGTIGVVSFVDDGGGHIYPSLYVRWPDYAIYSPYPGGHPFRSYVSPYDVVLVEDDV